jgi:hypothetical protein
MLKTKVIEAKATLIAILAREELPQAIGADALEMQDRSFLMVTCCARIVEDHVAKEARLDINLALRSLEALYADMREHVMQICQAGWRQ